MTHAPFALASPDLRRALAFHRGHEGTTLRLLAHRADLRRDDLTRELSEATAMIAQPLDRETAGFWCGVVLAIRRELRGMR